MSILGKIMGAIFGNHAEAATPTSAPEAERRRCHLLIDAAAAVSNVDVAAILDKAVARKKEKLAWRTSIVDLMKALDVNSSQNARKELAEELKYSGDTERFRGDECLAAQADDGSTRSQRWQAATRHKVMIRSCDAEFKGRPRRLTRISRSSTDPGRPTTRYRRPMGCTPG